MPALPGLGITAALMASRARPVFIGAGTPVHVGTLPRQMTLPTGSQVGDLAVYAATIFNSGGAGPTVTDNGGADATLRAYSAVGSSLYAGVWMKWLTQTDIDTGYIGMVGSGVTSAAARFIGVWRGATGAQFVSANAASSGATATLPSAPSKADYFAFAFLDDVQTTISTWPTSYTEGRSQRAENAHTAACAVAIDAQPGAESFVFGSSDSWLAALVRVY